MRYQSKPLSMRSRSILRKALPKRIYLRYFGRHEKMSLGVWKILASVVPEGRSILDIGAYDGDFAIAAREANPKVLIIAFEPNPDSFQRLSRLTKQYDVKLEDRAIAQERGVARFRCDSQQSSLVAEETQEATLEVRTISLDEWVHEVETKPFLIKIDVEDGAANVVRGAVTVMRDASPIILCEVLSNHIGSQIQEDLPHSYRFFYINENKGLERRQEIKRLDWRYKNWLFVPESLIDLVPSNLLV